jgi:hypothetical protein
VLTFKSSQILKQVLNQRASGAGTMTSATQSGVGAVGIGASRADGAAKD